MAGFEGSRREGTPLALQFDQPTGPAGTFSWFSAQWNCYITVDLTKCHTIVQDRDIGVMRQCRMKPTKGKSSRLCFKNYEPLLERTTVQEENTVRIRTSRTLSVSALSDTLNVSDSGFSKSLSRSSL